MDYANCFSKRFKLNGAKWKCGSMDMSFKKMHIWEACKSILQGNKNSHLFRHVFVSSCMESLWHFAYMQAQVCFGLSFCLGYSTSFLLVQMSFAFCPFFIFPPLNLSNTSEMINSSLPVDTTYYGYHRSRMDLHSRNDGHKFKIMLYKGY